MSDVLGSMNVSFSDAAKKGTVEINGNSSLVDETTFKESDVTFMISVKVGLFFKPSMFARISSGSALLIPSLRSRIRR